jgi:hemoglobin
MATENLPDKKDYLQVNSIKFTFEEMDNVVKKFYAKVAVDDHLQGPFSVVEDWPHHIDRLTHFWWIRFGGKPYMDVMYNPIERHFETGFSKGLLEIWLGLFQDVLNENLTIAQSELWFDFAGRIGEALNRNNDMMKKSRR